MCFYDDTQVQDSDRTAEWPLEMGGGRNLPWHNIDLPYGYWQRNDGSQVLFNRNYVPMLQRDADGANARACPAVWIDSREQRWFWATGKDAWPIAKLKPTAPAREYGEAVLAAFIAGRPIEQFVRDPAVPSPLG